MGAFAGRALPAWYDDAKFGVFIHWGLFSIPAFAPKVGKISDIFQTDYRRAVALSPYTEWYENAIKSRPTVAGYVGLSEAIGSAISKVLQGQGTPQEALDDAAKKADEALSDN